MISVDGSLFIQIVNFLFLVWVMNTLVYKPIRKILRERKETISGLQQGVETAENQAKEKDKAYSQGLREARAKGLQEKEKFMEAAAEEEKAIIDKINQKAQAELAAIRDKIAEDTETVRASLENEIDTFADAIGNKILGRAI